MARDYSSRQNGDKRNSAGNGRRPTAAAKRNAPAPKPRSRGAANTRRNTGGGGRRPPGRTGQTPGWVWGLCGLFVGIVAVSGYYIFGTPAGTPGGVERISVDLPSEHATQGSAPASGSAPAQPNADTPAAKKEKPRFSFYEMLPNYHVEVPDNDRDSGRSAYRAAHGPHEAPEPDNRVDTPLATGNPSDDASSPAPNRAPSTSDNGTSQSRFVIQAGAFSTRADADQRKARLALLGVTAEIVDVATSSGRTIYRVQSTRIDSGGEAHSLAQRLQSHGIETMLRHVN